MSVADIDGVKSLPAALPKEFGDVDILVNNAGSFYEFFAVCVVLQPQLGAIGNLQKVANCKLLQLR